MDFGQFHRAVCPLDRPVRHEIRKGNQQHGECHLFDLAPETASWSSRPCNQGRCAITHIHSERLSPRACLPAGRPPTSSAVQVNQEEISSRTFSP